MPGDVWSNEAHKVTNLCVRFPEGIPIPRIKVGRGQDAWSSGCGTWTASSGNYEWNPFRSEIRSTGSRPRSLQSLVSLLLSSHPIALWSRSRIPGPAETSSARFSSRCGKRHRHRTTSTAGINLRPAMMAMMVMAAATSTTASSDLWMNAGPKIPGVRLQLIT